MRIKGLDFVRKPTHNEFVEANFDNLCLYEAERKDIELTEKTQRKVEDYVNDGDYRELMRQAYNERLDDDFLFRNSD